MDPWTPPGKDCGACGAATCAGFAALLQRGEKTREDCPFCDTCTTPSASVPLEARYSGKDVLGKPYDFILGPLPGEPSARKIVLPFRPDLVERWEIVPGDIVLGRPMGQGCPIPHVLRVARANPVTGVLTCHTIGPHAARTSATRDVQAYHVVGFEGIATVVNRAPEFGLRQRFLPANCMMQIAHTGVVNMLLEQSGGLHVRVEDIRIL